MSAPNRKNFYTGFLILAILLLSLSVFYIYRTQPKIAYVRNLELIYGYNAMKQAHSEFKAKTSAWESNIDTLRMRYQMSVAKYQQDYKSLSAKERNEQVTLLQKMEADMRKYTQAVSDEAKREETEVTESILNQINSFVEKYAESKGYDMVFGTEGRGTILYGKKAFDITDEVLAALNSDYKILPADSSDQLK